MGKLTTALLPVASAAVALALAFLPHISSQEAEGKSTDPMASVAPKKPIGKLLKKFEEQKKGLEKNSKEQPPEWLTKLEKKAKELDDKNLTLHLHELLAYSAATGVALLMVVSQHGVLGAGMHQPFDASYLADTVILFRYFEHAGEIHKAISVTKRRGGKHEASIRALSIGTPEGVNIGKPLHDFRGVLTGMPEYHGTDPGKA